MTTTKGMKAIKELSAHSLSWYNEGNIKTENKEFQTVLNQINNFEDNINIMTEEVRMAQHKYETLMEERISKLEETLNNFIKESRLRQKDSENMVWRIKKTFGQTFKTQASSIKEIEIHLGRISKMIQDRQTGSLPSSTETNPRGLPNAITTRSGLNYKPPKNTLENITTSKEELTTKTTISNSEKESNNPRKPMESSDHSIPFPG
nr:hypothetical protein [Tanacetum cinerariifolium]